MPQLTLDLAQQAVATGAARYFAERRARVRPFVKAHFSLSGALRLHRVALGWDTLRAPVNLSLAAPQIVLRLVARALRRRAPRLSRRLDRTILLPTSVSREIVWLIHTELLELPYAQRGRESRRDALAETILREPAVEQALAEHGPAFRARVAHAMAEYSASRAAAAEITTGLLSLGAGAITLNKLTPGAASLGPTLAAVLAQQAAVASFPLGGWLGGIWYGWFPAVPSGFAVAWTTGALMLAAASFAAFAGVVADPVQRLLGLHQARLMRMIAALERQFSDETAPGFSVRDHYVARLLDVFDIAGAAMRIVRP